MKIAGLALFVLVALSVAGAGWFVSSETALVRIWTPERHVQTVTTVRGATADGQFKTQRLQVSISETATGSGSGIAKTAATYATGWVVFNGSCTQPYPLCPPAPAPAGHEVWSFNHTTGEHWGYVLLQTVTCFCGEKVPVRAEIAGSGPNTAAGTVNYIGFGMGYWQGTVNNPDPITGGANATSSPVVLQSDIDATKGSVAAQISDDVKAAIEAKARGLHYVADGAPVISIASSVAAGAHAATFAVTATGSLGATAFADSDLAPLIAGALEPNVPTGFQLVGSPVLSGYKIESFDAQGNIMVTVTVAGNVAPFVSRPILRQRLRGVDMNAARQVVEAAVPGGRVEITIWPRQMPRLPFNDKNISIDVIVSAGADGRRSNVSHWFGIT